MPQPTQAKSIHIPSLDGLRAISVIMVIFYHFNLHYLAGAAKVPWSFFANGDLGVNVFFVISGFLITTLLMRELATTHSISFKQFYIRRTLRIFPAYYFVLVVYFALQLCGVIHISSLSWLTSITYTKYLYKPDWVTKHFWSLSVEEHFYLLWPLVFALGGQVRKYFTLAIVCAIPAIRIINMHYNYGWMDATSIFQRGDAIIFGCLLALHYSRVKAFVGRMLQKSRLLILLPFLILFLLYLAGIAPSITPWYNFAIVAIGTTFGTLANICISVIIVISIEQKNAWYNFLNLRALSFIGKLSYSLYLWQQIFLYPNLKYFSIFPLNLVGIIVMALISYYLVERPFLKLKKVFAAG